MTTEGEGAYGGGDELLGVARGADGEAGRIGGAGGRCGLRKDRIAEELGAGEGRAGGHGDGGHGGAGQLEATRGGLRLRA